MDPNYPYEDKSVISPYQQQQLETWKVRIKKFFIAAWPYIMRGMNDFFILMLNVIRGSIRIIKEQMFRS